MLLDTKLDWHTVLKVKKYISRSGALLENHFFSPQVPNIFWYLGLLYTLFSHSSPYRAKNGGNIYQSTVLFIIPEHQRPGNLLTPSITLSNLLIWTLTLHPQCPISILERDTGIFLDAVWKALSAKTTWTEYTYLRYKSWEMKWSRQNVLIYWTDKKRRQSFMLLSNHRG